MAASILFRYQDARPASDDTVLLLLEVEEIRLILSFENPVVEIRLDISIALKNRTSSSRIGHRTKHHLPLFSKTEINQGRF